MSNRLHKLFIITLFLCSTVYGQYEIQSSHLQNPETIKSHVDSNAIFWIPTYDTIYGGFYANVSRDGGIVNDEKTMLGQTRTAYGMVRAFMLSGDTTYLNYARGALDFMYEHAWDSTNQGWYNEMDREGNLDPTGNNYNQKWSFMQNYALLGVAAMVEATQNHKDWQFLLDGRAVVDEHLWDSRPDYLGYYDYAARDWSNPYNKGFTPTMDAVTTHVLAMYLLIEETEYKDRLMAMADDAVDHFLPAMSMFNYGFPEHYSSNWVPNTNNTLVFTGHLLKSAWCVTRAHLIEPKPEYIDYSNTLLDEVLSKGYDHENGGCYTNYNGATGQRYDTNKEWWQLEEAFTSGIMNYYITGNETYLQMADETLKFYMSYMVDPVYGEVYTFVTRTGDVVDDTKASYWKAGYHSIELGYLVYLYGNLYLHHNPVELYYYYQPADSNRSIKLYPLAIEDDNLELTEVLLNGQPYTNFLSEQRILNIPQGTGGIFRATFENINVTSIDAPQLAESFELHQNYPNPFNPTSTISFSIPELSFVTIKVYDVLGNEIAVLVNEEKPAGEYKVEFSATDLPSSIYFYRLQAGSFVETKKMMLMK